MMEMAGLGRGRKLHAVREIGRPVRVMLVDDHAVVREGVRTVLADEAGLEVVGEYGCGNDALRDLPALKPDVVVLDLRMPGLSAAEAIRRMRALLPELKVLVFTSFADDAQMRDVLDAGITGYLLKDVPRSELIHAVKSVAQGVSCLHPNVQGRLVALVKRPAPDPAALTPRELSVLRLIAEGQSNKRIARKLDLTEGTVKGYVSQILQKLGLRDRTQAALYAVRNGLADA